MTGVPTASPMCQWCGYVPMVRDLGLRVLAQLHRAVAVGGLRWDDLDDEPGLFRCVPRAGTRPGDGGAVAVGDRGGRGRVDAGDAGVGDGLHLRAEGLVREGGARDALVRPVRGTAGVRAGSRPVHDGSIRARATAATCAGCARVAVVVPDAARSTHPPGLSAARQSRPRGGGRQRGASPPGRRMSGKAAPGPRSNSSPSGSSGGVVIGRRQDLLNTQSLHFPLHLA